MARVDIPETAKRKILWDNPIRRTAWTLPISAGLLTADRKKNEQWGDYQHEGVGPDRFAEMPVEQKAQRAG